MRHGADCAGLGADGAVTEMTNMFPKNDNSGAPETASPETPLDRVVNYIKGAMRPQSIAAATCEGPWDRGRRSGLQEALNSINAEFAKQPAPPAPEPQTPAQPAEECNHAEIPEGLACLECVMADLQRLSTAHETLQADYADSLAVSSAFQRMATERREQLETLQAAHDQLRASREQAYQNAGSWAAEAGQERARAEKAEAELASLRSSRETEQRKAIAFGWHRAFDFANLPYPSGEDRVDELLRAYQQRQPQEGGQS